MPGAEPWHPVWKLGTRWWNPGTSPEQKRVSKPTERQLVDAALLIKGSVGAMW
jgi:hypothetical protein